MQQTLPFWIDVLRQDKAAVAAFYEPGALFRDDVKMELVVAELRALEGARHFQFDFKTNVSAIASLYAATTSSAAAAFPSVAVSASSFVENAFGFGRSAFTAASAAARGGIENVKKNSESLLTVASSSLGSSPTAEPGKSRPASGGTAREVEKEGQVPDLDSFRELYEKGKAYRSTSIFVTGDAQKRKSD
ncbi:hypothetical protein DFJ73DRAFT_428330 [Zopfochytrium polystomum]|nr:hypothetical protein DFJ73DRAFT_428330 [Zopfochytrium polystomum]